MISKSQVIAAIVILIVAIYANSLSGGFVSDDIPTIANNPQIGNILTCRDWVGLSNWLSYKIAGLNPWSYHLSNLILHAINSILVFYFLLIFFERIPSFWAALLFAAHPIQTEAVTWISGKPYLLFTLFLLCSFLLYRQATRQDKLKIGPYLGCLLLYILAFFGHWFALCFSGMIILYDFTYQRWRNNWPLWVPLILISSGLLLLKSNLIGQRVSALQVTVGSTGASNPIFNMAFSLFNHLWLVVWPSKLTLYHEPLQISAQLLGLQILGLVLVLSILPILFKKAKPLLLAAGLFVLFLTPTYSPVMITWLVAERYLYFPLIACSMLAAFFWQRYACGANSKRIATILAIILIGAYSVRTIIRNKDWRNRASLWRATVRVSPESAKAHNNMGDIYYLEGDLERSAEAFKRATELKPNYADAYHNLAHSYQKMGKIDLAIVNYKKAIKFNSNLYQSYQNLAAIYLSQGQVSLAQEYLDQALSIK